MKLRSVLLVLAFQFLFAILGGLSSFVEAQPVKFEYVGSAGQYKGRDVHIGRVQNTEDGSWDYFTATFPVPGVGQYPYPAIVFVNPYDVLSVPPSTNFQDIEWNNSVRRGPPFPDVSLPPQFRFVSCTNTSTGDCLIPVFGLPALNDVARTAVDHDYQNPTSDWALANGYAVVVVFTRYYSGRGIYTNITAVENVIEALKGLPSFVNGSKIGLTGGSQGGQLSVHSLAMPNRPMSIAAAVPLYGVYDGRAWYEHFFVKLQDMQSTETYQQTRNGSASLLNRAFRSFGTDPNGPGWDPVSLNSVSSLLNTPVLLLHGSDDTSAPASQSINLYNALKAKGKTANMWIYQNGVLDLNHVTGHHGAFDSNSAAKYTFLQRNFFLYHMPPDVGEVVYRVPQDINLYGFVAEMLGPARTLPAPTDNTYQLLLQAANSRIRYVSSDPRVPSGDGWSVMVNLVFSYLSRP